MLHSQLQESQEQWQINHSHLFFADSDTQEQDQRGEADYQEYHMEYAQLGITTKEYEIYQQIELIDEITAIRESAKGEGPGGGQKQ